VSEAITKGKWEDYHQLWNVLIHMKRSGLEQAFVDCMERIDVLTGEIVLLEADILALKETPMAKPMSENYSDGVQAVLDEANQRIFELSCYASEYATTHTKKLRDGLAQLKAALEKARWFDLIALSRDEGEALEILDEATDKLNISCNKEVPDA
jgi:hypothetical protein